MKIKEVIVVEGKSDTVKVQQAVTCDTIETNGSAINQETIERIRHAKEKRGVIIFTDPDYPGKRIRHIIDKEVPGCKHAFLTRAEAKDNRSTIKNLGIEHASLETIRHALEKVYELVAVQEASITKADLIHYGLIGQAHSKEKRDALGNLLRIGETNGKQLLKRLNMFQISKEQLSEAMEQLRGGK
ncbi:MAG TPA: ribonuclease M5 [Bacillota bacterium]|nr:ribonuclease M5 [Bacillota bacterium]